MILPKFYIVNKAEVGEKPITWQEALFYSTWDTVWFAIRWALLCFLIWISINSLSSAWIVNMGKDICPLIK